MASKFNWIVPDRLVEIVFFDELVKEDMLILHQLDLASKQKPIYILVDDSHIQLTIPDGAFRILDQTDGKNPIIGHVVFFGAPTVMEIFTKLLVKLIQLKNKVEFYPTREQALARLYEIMAQEDAGASTR